MELYNSLIRDTLAAIGSPAPRAWDYRESDCRRDLGSSELVKLVRVAPTAEESTLTDLSDTTVTDLVPASITDTTPTDRGRQF